jgi:hypothetical protein
MRLRIVVVAAAVLASPAILAPRTASAESLFDFFFGGTQKQQQKAPAQASFSTIDIASSANGYPAFLG